MTVDDRPATHCAGERATDRPPRYVVKLGSACLRHGSVFAEVAALVTGGARVLLVAGGAEGVREHYTRIGRTVRTVRLRNGDTVRYVPPDEVPHLVDAYTSVTLPRVRRALAGHGLTVHAATACTDRLVEAAPMGPLRVVEEGRQRIVRDHRAGTVVAVDGARLDALLDDHDVVCLCPPVAATDDGTPLNVDADVLAAHLALAVAADHLRLVTGTAGVLADPERPDSTVPDLRIGEGMGYARGRMRQKVRAAELAVTGVADVVVTGPHTLAIAGGTRFRPAPPAE
ncbi:MAG: hypothetical protein WCA46_03515 [Actinocatenispora sp.]